MPRIWFEKKEASFVRAWSYSTSETTRFFSAFSSTRSSPPTRSGVSSSARSDGVNGHVRQGGVTPQRHPDHQLAATSSPFTSSTVSPSIASSRALASDSALM